MKGAHIPTQDEDDVVTEKPKRRDQQAPRVAGEIYTVLTIGQRIRDARAKALDAVKKL